MQVVCRGLDGNVPHIERQFRQLSLNIGSISIPADKRLHSEAVPQIMHAGPLALLLPHSRTVEELVDRTLKSGVTVLAAAATVAIAQERRVWMNGECFPSFPQVGLKLTCDAPGEWDQTRLVELRLADPQHRALFLNVAHC
jgi:hypothetical protein